MAIVIYETWTIRRTCHNRVSIQKIGFSVNDSLDCTCKALILYACNSNSGERAIGVGPTLNMRKLYRFAKVAVAFGGSVLVAYGLWLMTRPFFFPDVGPGFWFGLFPLYLGAMMILVSLAMKEDWFTNARKYW